MDMQQLKTRIKHKLLKEASFGEHISGGAKAMWNPIQHAYSQFKPPPDQVTDVQKIKNFMKSDALQEAFSGVKGMGKTALGLGMAIPAAGMAAYHLGPDAAKSIAENPRVAGAGVGALGGAAIGHKLTGGPVASILGGLSGAYLGSKAVD